MHKRLQSDFITNIYASPGEKVAADLALSSTEEEVAI
jgi:hypothetical protein